MQAKIILAGLAAIFIANQCSAGAQTASNSNIRTTSKAVSTTKPKNSSPVGTARNIRTLYSTSKSSRTNYSAMPEWWKQEYRRRQTQTRLIQWQSAREAQALNRQMADPRSREAMETRRLSALAHRNMQASGASSGKNGLPKAKGTSANSATVKPESVETKIPTQ